MKRNGASKQVNDDEAFEDLKISKKVTKEVKLKKDKSIKETVTKKITTRAKSAKIKVESKIGLTIKKIAKKVGKKAVIAGTSTLTKAISGGLSLIGPVCVRLGLCCINNYLRDQKNSVFCSRSITLQTYKSKGKEEALTRATLNVKDIETLLHWNHNHHIHCLRLSSDLFPHYSNTSRIKEEDQYTLDFIADELERIGKLAKDLGHRITMHPGQFNVVGSPNEDAFKQTIVDLKMHADILDLMKLDANSIMVVHGGGVYGDKEATLKRWAKNFYRLPENVQRRLVLENDEKNFSIVDCLAVNKEIGIPLVFDNHHFECYKILHPEEEFEEISTYIKPVLDTWISKGMRPKFHISNQNREKRTGAHSDFISKFPDYYLEIPEKHGVGVDIMVEAKAKEAAILDLYQRYKQHFLRHLGDIEVDDSILLYDKEKMQAKKCHACNH